MSLSDKHAAGRSDPGLRILHLSLGRKMRGGERQVSLLHRGLIERGWDSLLLAREGGGLHLQGLPNLIPLAWRGEWDVGGFFRVLSRCRQQRPCILHCHDNHALNHGAPASALLRFPIVTTRRVVFAPRRSIFDHWKYRQCSRVIAISSAVADQCRTVVSDHRIRIVHSAVPLDIPMLRRDEARRELGIAPDSRVIGTVGHFTAEKELGVIAEVARRVAARCAEARFVCIGPAARAPAEMPSLVMAGLIPDAVRFYSAFDLYLSASASEGLGTALLDAIVRDIPTVATDAGGTRDIFPANYPLYRPGDVDGLSDSITRAIGDPGNTRNRAILAGNRARELFSVEKMVNSVVDIYREIRE